MRATRGAANRSPPGSGFAVEDRVARARASRAGARLRPAGYRQLGPGSRAGSRGPSPPPPAPESGAAAATWAEIGFQPPGCVRPGSPSLESQPGSGHRGPEPAPSAGRRGDTQEGFVTPSSPQMIFDPGASTPRGIPQFPAALALASVASVSTFEADRMGMATQTSGGAGQPPRSCPLKTSFRIARASWS